MPDSGYLPRHADARLAALVGEFPAVLINGPRAVGKTTTARQLAADLVRMDQPAQAAAFEADPDAALRGRGEPLLIDEWQEVPAVLGAVRRAVDEDPRPGRFLLTGSVRAEQEHAVWAGTGRLVRLTMHGLTELEIDGGGSSGGPSFLERLATADPAQLPLPVSVPQLPDYIAKAVRGSFPEVALRHDSEEARRTWMESYLDQLLTRDALHHHERRDPARLARYFEALALNTAGAPTDATLRETAGINAKTAAGYDEIL